MGDGSLEEANRLVAAANAGRGHGGADDGDAADAERQLESRFRTSQTLAVYGTLAPGEPNYHIVAPLGGEWTDGIVEGDLYPVGWGATLGYRAFRPRAGGPAIAVKVLTTPALVAAWPDLDRFEGAEYRRILVPVFAPGPAGKRRLYTVANLYAASQPGPAEAAG